MILTITPSPAIDWTVAVDAFDLGAVNRATLSTREASGKGVNVAWALHAAGRPTHALFPAGGSSAAFMTTQLGGADLPHTVIRNTAEVRTNISLVVGGRSGTKINEAGALLDAEALDALLASVDELASRASLVVSCGSLPSGAPVDLHGRIVERCRAAGVPVVVDASGAPLEAALPCRPSLIKPNVHELAELAGRRLETFGDVIDAALAMLDRGPEAMLVSLGADGALHASRDGVVHAVASGIPVVNAVGAGDALLAGFVSVDGSVAERMRVAVLWASSAVSCPTTLFPVRDELADRILVGDVDRDAPLSEPGTVEFA